MNKNKKEEIAIKILDYLRKNPEAKDTLEGITRWWLGLENINVSVEEVSKALEELIIRGLLIKEEVSGGRAYYKISKKGESKLGQA